MNFLLPYLVRWNSFNRSRYFQICKILSEKGHNVHVIQPPPMNTADTGFMEESPKGCQGILLHDVSLRSGLLPRKAPFDKVMRKGWYCIRANDAMKKLVEQNEIHAVLFYNMALYGATRLRGVTSVYDLGDDHVDLLQHELGRFRNRMVERLARVMLMRTLRKADVVFSASHHLREKYALKSSVLPNGVNMDEVNPGGGRVLRGGYHGPVIGFVGSLEYFIPFDQILDAAERLRDHTFVIAGGGREYEGLVRQKERRRLGNLVLTGGLPHGEIMRHIDSFDICLNLFVKSPLTHGACPIKLFEYMAYKKPIISARIREVERIDRDFLFWADSAEELVATIRKIMTDGEKAKICGEKGFAAVNENYTWARIADAFLERVQEAVARKNGHG